MASRLKFPSHRRWCEAAGGQSSLTKRSINRAGYSPARQTGDERLSAEREFYQPLQRHLDPGELRSRVLSFPAFPRPDHVQRPSSGRRLAGDAGHRRSRVSGSGVTASRVGDIARQLSHKPFRIK